MVKLPAAVSRPAGMKQGVLKQKVRVPRTMLGWVERGSSVVSGACFRRVCGAMVVPEIGTPLLPLSLARLLSLSHTYIYTHTNIHTHTHRHCPCLALSLFLSRIPCVGEMGCMIAMLDWGGWVECTLGCRRDLLRCAVQTMQGHAQTIPGTDRSRTKDQPWMKHVSAATRRLRLFPSCAHSRKP